MTHRAFDLPDNGYAYAEKIFSRAHDFIRSRIWTEVKPHRLRRWEQNFETPVERYFGACLLDSLIYRSVDQTVSLLQHQWHEALPSALGSAGDEVLERLRNKKIDPMIRIVPVVDRRFPTKSGYHIARILEKQLRVNSKYIIDPSDADKLSKGLTVVFVDDFLGGGTQFERLIGRGRIAALSDRHRLVYAPLAAHERGARRVRDRSPTVLVVPGESLDDSHRIFSAESGAFADGVNTPASARDFYDTLTTTRGISRMRAIDGVEHLGIAYVFHHAAPNNNVEIFWSGSSHWTPLFER